MANPRNTKLYKSLTPYMACAIAEGFCEGDEASAKEQLIAWQYIADTGLWRHLQGFYGRTIHALLKEEVIRPPRKSKK